MHWVRLQRLRKASRVLGVSVATLGGAVLLSRVFDLWPGREGVRAPFGWSALACVLAGLGLWLAGRSLDGDGKVDRWPRLLGICVALLGGGVFFEQTMAPSELPVLVSVSLVFLGVALVFLGVEVGRTRLHIAEWLVLVPGATALLCFQGYVFDIPVLYAESHWLSMSPPTSLALLGSSASVLFHRADAGLLRPLVLEGPAGVLARRLLPAALLLPFCFRWLRVQFDAAWPQHGELGVAAFAVLSSASFVALVLWVSDTLADMEEARRAARTALEEREQDLATTLDSIGDGVIATDVDERITRMNPVAERLTGWSQERAKGRKLLEVFHIVNEDTRQKVESPVTRVLRDGTVTDLAQRTLLLSADGTERAIADSGAPIRDASDNVRGVVLVFRDVTEEQRQAAALRETESQLRQAQKMEAIGSLAGGIAHDFNNLLTIILSYTKLLLQDLPEGDRVRADLTEIDHAGQRAAELTNQLLAFSRRQVLRPVVVNLNEVLEGMRKMLVRVLRADIELTILPNEDLGAVRVDPTQIEQVVMNLAVNARDAMPSGGKLTIETRNVDLDRDYASSHLEVTPGPYVMLSVTDSGTGMDAETRARIFEPFFTTKEVGKGTGLGLATVFGIVRQSAGSIWVYSEPSAGTTFKVYLPRVAEPAVRIAPARKVTQYGGAEAILLVEDDEHVRAVVAVTLRKSGYYVLEAANGGEAILISEQFDGKIDLLLSDLVMPRLSGRQLAERLHATRPTMRVLFMSGYTDDAVVRHGLLASDTHFLQKPIVPDVLLRKVRQVLDVS